MHASVALLVSTYFIGFNINRTIPLTPFRRAGVLPTVKQCDIIALTECDSCVIVLTDEDYTMLAEFKMMGAGLACSGLGGVGQGIGQIFSSLVEAMANNPGISKGLFNYALIGFALTEAVALFILMITFLILF